MDKTPEGIEIEEMKEHLEEIENVEDVHHVHVWSLDGFNHYATMHVVTDLKDTKELRKAIKEELKEHGIGHITIEFEEVGYVCEEPECVAYEAHHSGHHHHHHGHHHHHH